MKISQHWFRKGLGGVMQKAITWASVEPYLCRHMGSLNHNNLVCLIIISKVFNHGPLARYLNLRVTHATGMPRTFSPPSRVKRLRQATRHVRHARPVMHAGIANKRFPLKSVAGKSFPAFPAHAQPTILRIWQEAYYASWFTPGTRRHAIF